jgi:hypothetical protein
MPPSVHPGELIDMHALVDGGSDPEKNIALSNVIEKVRASGVPKANIESALEKVCGLKISSHTVCADMDMTFLFYCNFILLPLLFCFASSGGGLF